MLRGEDPLEAWPRVEARLAPIFDCQPLDPDKVVEAIDVLAHWTELAAHCNPQHTGEQEETLPDSALLSQAAFATAHAVASTISDVHEDPLPVHSSPRDEPRVDEPACWEQVDEDGLFVAKGSTESSTEDEQVVAETDSQPASIEKTANTGKEAIAKADQKEKEKEKKRTLKPKDPYNIYPKNKTTLYSRSSTPQSRANIAKAKQQVAKWRERLLSAEAKRDRLTDQEVQSGGKSKGAQKQANRERQKRIEHATNKLQAVEKELGLAQKNLTKTKQANRDPLRVQKEAEQKDREKKESEKQKNRVEQLGKKLKKTKSQLKAIDRQIKKDPKNADSFEDKQQQLKAKQKRLTEQRDAAKNDSSKPGKSTLDKIKDATTVKLLEGKKVFLEKEKYLVPERSLYTSEDGSGSITGKAIGAETTGTATAKLTSTGFSGSVELSGQATLAEIRLKKDWVVPHKLLGEQVQANMFVDVRGFVGVEAEAKLKANLGKLPADKADIDQNAIMAGVDAFAGAKVQIGAGVGYSWFKQDLSVYRPRIESGVALIHGILITACPAIGAILTLLDKATGVTEKLLGKLLDHSSKPGLVPLASVTGKGEASLGAGLRAKAAVGLRHGQFVTQLKANATWGFGLGAELELMLDILEGPLFLLLNPEVQEFVAMLSRYLRQQVKSLGSLGFSIGNRLREWLSSDDKARAIVAKEGHTVLSLDDRVILVENMLGGACMESDEQAILTVLRDAKKRGDLSALLSRVGKRSLSWKIDGDNNDELHRLIDSR